MSPLKLAGGRSLDDELDDFDGADYNYEEDENPSEELSPEDKEQMQIGTASVRSVLGPEVLVSDKEIQDSLWHYYYDVDKTVTYLLNQQSSKSKRAKKGPDVEGKGAKGGSNLLSASLFLNFGSKLGFPYEFAMVRGHMQPVSNCLNSFSTKDFFRDCPWFNVPLHRQGEILIEPLYPRGGLLGGNPSEAAPKVSKLAALAAARKRKDNVKSGADGAKSISTPIALLDKLSISGPPSEKQKSLAKGLGPDDHSRKRLKTDAIDESAADTSRVKETRKYSKKTLKAITPPPEDIVMCDEDPTSSKDSPEQPPLLAAAPSAFARTMFGSSFDTSGLTQRSAPSFARFGPCYASWKPLTELNPFAGPSPDDIVAQAQSASKGIKGSKSKMKVKPINSEKSVKEVTESVAKTSINSISNAKSKNLDVMAEYGSSKAKNAANFVVIGHVDAGKSTLMGRLLYDLGVVDQRTIDKYRKEAETIGKSSFALAWVLDQDTEERNRGVTIDIAMNKFETEKTKFTILDAPGHRDFIPNMIAGASQADFAVLVIDASTGNFESGLKGQTKEHALLVRSMGVQRLIVTINKLDTVSWSRDRFEEIEQQMSAFLSGAGFQSKNVSFVPCSGLTGANIVSRATDPNASWYDGAIFIDLLESSEPIARALEKPLRLTVGDIFRGGVQNPLSISGRIDAGSVQIGDQVLAIPSGETASIKALDVDNEPADWAVAGQNVTLHLSDIDAKHLKAGDIICPPSAPVKSSKSLTVKILAFEHVTPMYVEVHRGRLQAAGRVTELVAVLDKGSGVVIKKKPRLVKPGDVARVVVEVEVEGGVPLEAPARVVLRAGGETVAAGLLE